MGPGHRGMPRRNSTTTATGNKSSNFAASSRKIGGGLESNPTGGKTAAKASKAVPVTIGRPSPNCRERVSEVSSPNMPCNTGGEGYSAGGVLAMGSEGPSMDDQILSFGSFAAGGVCETSGALMSSNALAYVQNEEGEPCPVSKSRNEQGSGEIQEERTKGENKGQKVPVYVMLPLDTVNGEGVFRYASSDWFEKALKVLACSGVRGVAVDVWWGGVEREPAQYDWAGYRQLFDTVKNAGLKLQVVMSFHACGGNVGDVVQIPLPAWVLEAGESDPDLFFADRPRNKKPGQRNKECISFFADETPGVLMGRSPLQCYEDFMTNFRDAFYDELGTLVMEVVVGAGPCGELRYPSYVEANGWRFPGIGEFQCYDRRALASLAKAAKLCGNPEWGYAGPHDAGTYNNSPGEAPFFIDGGSWETPYGHFFLKWYSDSLLEHGDRILSVANKVFGPKLRQHPKPRESFEKPTTVIDGVGSWVGKAGMMFNQASSTTSVSDLCMNSSTVSMSRGTDSLESIRPDPSPGSLSTAMPSTQSMDMLDMMVVTGDATGGEGDSEENEQVFFERQFGPLTPVRVSRLGISQLQDQLECTVSKMTVEGGSSPSSGSDLLSLGQADSSNCEGCGDGDGSESPMKRWGAGEFFRTIIAGFLGGRAVEDCGIDLKIKIPGIHWWYGTRSHAGELTAGYYNTVNGCGYEGVVNLCAKHGVKLTLTCVEMCDEQHPPQARCSPQSLLRQVRDLASSLGVEMCGENALPIFGREGVDSGALDRIVNNRGWESGSQWNGSAPKSDVRQQSCMHSFTFLRLGPEILDPRHQGQWMRFMEGMQSV